MNIKVKAKFKPFVTVVLDGFGLGPKYDGNAVALAKTPNFDKLKKNFLYTELGATGIDVGLEAHQMSGSEVGHMNIGAGRIVDQESKKISQDVESGAFFQNPVLMGAMSHVKQFESKLHIMGLLSNGDSPHSRMNHFSAILELARRQKVKEVYIHFFTDGRDSKPQSAIEHFKEWERAMKQSGLGKVATIGGRYYGMDRSKNWDRLRVAYDAMVEGKGETAGSFEEAVQQAYKNNLTDEYIKPTVIMESGHPVARIGDNDAVVFFNLRSDRARQFTKLFVLSDCAETKLPQPRLKNLFFVALTEFGPNINVHTAYTGKRVANSLPNILTGWKQLYISETEKFAHVTYFLNGGFPGTVAGEDRIMIPSPDVKSYAEVPEMSAKLLTEVIVKYLKNKNYNFILLNFPNADMLGHTGDIKAAIKGIEFVDKCLGNLWKELDKLGGGLFLTADHGNADEMLDKKTGEILTYHTRNPVPLVLANHVLKGKKLASGGVLGNISPTILEVMGVDPGEEMINSLLN